MRSARRTAWRSPWSSRSDSWADWIKALDGKSGVYVIRNSRSKQILYVGRSYTGRLKKTLIRHFQRWKGLNAGVVYRRGEVEVSVKVMPKRSGTIERVEQRYIAGLRPRDNETGWPDEVPF